MNIAQSQKQIATGIVEEALPDTHFRIILDTSGERILAYLAGKMKMNRIRVLVGDKVEVELDQYGGKARIVRRI
ncbi:MAG: translation initiation factor IF-1 [Patescibacteria group bacterium]|nr:translation initiation factor IF-1 [Patescibacteria group bacterium]